jgi:structural maintenance of chromosome 4
LQEKILQVGGVKFRSQKAVVDGIQEQITTLKDRIAKFKVEKASRERNMGKLNAAIKVKEEEIKELDTEMDNIKNTLETCLESAASVRVKVTEAKDVLLEKETLMEKLKSRIDSNTEIVNEIRRNAVELKAQISEYSQKVFKKTKIIQQAENEISQLSIQVTGYSKKF